MRLLALRLALDHTRADVVLGGNTSNGLDVLALSWKVVSVVVPPKRDREGVDGLPMLRGRYRLTFRYSLLASWYSLVMVGGGPRAKKRAVPKRMPETPTPSMTYMKILVLSPGGASARGP